MVIIKMDAYASEYLPAVEAELRIAVNRGSLGLEEVEEMGYIAYHMPWLKVLRVHEHGDLEEMGHMLAYQLGWEGEGAGVEARGKRVRPLLVLLTNESAGGEWRKALPAAAAVELIHNFSLIHDDIQDNSPLRRGRPTLWKKWGIPQAINTGDAMFTLAHLTLLRLWDNLQPSVVLQASLILNETCLHLTQGQYLDLAYENRSDLGLEAYFPMVEGKTAALLAACTELGALLAQVGDEKRQSYREFGRLLGLAFQAQDDLLGIWGDAALTGKSTSSDLVTGKKTLPVLFALDQNGAFARRWKQGKITPEELPAVIALLEEDGARDYTEQTAHRFTEQSLEALENAQPKGEAGQALRELALQLVGRHS